MADADTDLITRLFTREVPEIGAGAVEIKAVARKAGYRTKVAVSSIDPNVDCVGVCVGMRGERIKKIVDELGGERIDIVRWNDSLQILIPNALQPAAIEEVFLYDDFRRAIVMVEEDQQSLARGLGGQNAQLASTLVGWRIELMTFAELHEAIDLAEDSFRRMPEVNDALVDLLIEKGVFSYRDLASLTPEKLAQLVGIPYRQAEAIIRFSAEMENWW